MCMRIAILLTALAALSLDGAPALAEPVDPADDIFPVMTAEQWGVVEADGTEIIPAEYDAAFVWSDGLVEARKGGMTALFAPDGTLLVPLRYEQLYGNDAMAGGSRDNSWFWAHNRWGRERWIVGVGGEPLLGPGLNPLTPFDGRDRFIVEDQGRDGILSLDCEWILRPTLGAIGGLAENGLAWAQTFDGRDGYIDADGKWVIEPGRFERLGYFADDGWAPAQQGGKWGFIDARGEWMIPPMSEADFRPEPFNVEGLTVFEQGGKSGFVDRQGRWVGKPEFDGIAAYLDGSFIAHRDGERRRYSAAGEDLGLAPFDSANFVRFDESRTGRTTRDGKAMLVDWAGREVIGKGFEDVLPFGKNAWAPAKKGGKWGAVGRSGAWVLKPAYDCVGHCALPPGSIPSPVAMANSPSSERVPFNQPSDARYTDPKSQPWCHARD